MSVSIGDSAPDFTASAVLADGNIINDFCLSEKLKGKYGLLFFYPLDFTFVCPSELIALNKRASYLKKLEVEIIGISIDSAFTHAAWRNTSPQDGGIGPLDFTLVSDMSQNIGRHYGIRTAQGIALRATYILDKNRVIQSITINNLPLGRNIDEFCRLIEALQFHEKHGEVCPAGWTKEKKSMTASPDGVKAYLSEFIAEL